MADDKNIIAEGDDDLVDYEEEDVSLQEKEEGSKDVKK